MKKVDHTCIRVMDLDATKKFYEDAFGFEVTKESDFPDYEFTLTYMNLPGQDFSLELTYNYDQKEPYDMGNGYSHIGLLVEDVKALHEEHKAKGYEVTDLKGLPGTEPFYYFVSDPDGYRIEVIQDGAMDSF